ALSSSRSLPAASARCLRTFTNTFSRECSSRSWRSWRRFGPNRCVVPRSAAFLGKFLLAAGVLFGLWSLARASDSYSRVVLLVADPVMWLFSGFHVVSTTPTDAGLDIFIGKGTQRLLLPLQPR